MEKDLDSKKKPDLGRLEGPPNKNTTTNQQRRGANITYKKPNRKKDKGKARRTKKIINYNKAEADGAKAAADGATADGAKADGATADEAKAAADGATADGAKADGATADEAKAAADAAEKETQAQINRMKAL